RSLSETGGLGRHGHDGLGLASGRPRLSHPGRAAGGRTRVRRPLHRSSALTVESRDDEVAVLLAERSITRVLHSYAHGYDQGRLDQVRACYWDDATDEHTDVFSGPVDDYVQ